MLVVVESFWRKSRGGALVDMDNMIPKDQHPCEKLLV
jgi:hypothetical protein